VVRAELAENFGVIENERGLGAFGPSAVTSERTQLVLLTKN
jgi:hypothetical protein